MFGWVSKRWKGRPDASPHPGSESKPGRGSGFPWLALAALLPVSLLFLQARLPSEPNRDYKEAGYIGLKECLKCHDERTHFLASNHRQTWLPVSALDDIPELPQKIVEEGITHSVEKIDGRWSYRVQLPGRPLQTIPIHSIMGGERFGISLILRADEIEGRRLPRSTLVEARFMLEAGSHKLKHSPGLFQGVPKSYNTVLGRVMNPVFAGKCLGCHTGPIDQATADAGGPHPEFLDIGVGCERCHGPGQAHVRAVDAKQADLRIRHPGKLSNRKLLEVCGQCHTGFESIVHPRPDDLLISNQVTAMTNSECFIQSDAGFSCLDCHDPHKNAVKGDPAYVMTCLGCHSPRKVETTVCPVNASDGCISCHMPENVQQDSFHLTDHWIRVIREK